MLADATHDLGREQRLSCRCNAPTALPGSSNAAPGPKRCCPSGCARKRFRGVSSEGDSLSEDTPLPSRLADSAFWSQRGLSRVFQQPAWGRGASAALARKSTDFL